jgi:hypothetical protein
MYGETIRGLFARARGSGACIIRAFLQGVVSKSPHIGVAPTFGRVLLRDPEQVWVLAGLYYAVVL